MKGAAYFVGGAGAGAVGIVLYSGLLEPISRLFENSWFEFTLVTPLYSAPVTIFLLVARRIGAIGALVQTVSITQAHLVAFHAAVAVYRLGGLDPPVSVIPSSTTLWQAGALGVAIGSAVSFAAMAALASSLRTRAQMTLYVVFVLVLTLLAGVWFYALGEGLVFAISIPWQAVFTVALLLAFREAKTR